MKPQVAFDAPPTSVEPAVALRQERLQLVSNTGLALRRFMRHRRALFGLITLVVLLVLTAFAPVVTRFDPNAIDYESRFVPPGRKHLFGTDNIGRDYFSRCLYGGRISLGVGFVAMAISVSLGTTIGSAAGYFGGRIDSVLMRTVDFILSLPLFFIILIAQVLLRPHIVNVMIVIGLTSWMGVSRIVRGEVMAQRVKEYVTASRTIGCSSARIIFRHILPNVAGPIIVVATLNVAQAILVESALSFLGMGVQPPQASWGSMLSGAQMRMFIAPWVAIFPGLLLALTVVSFNFVGDGLRDALDPRSDRR
ncbi:MAG: ABC transporter permease [Armatimonadetes bacterium]|nr:ABC transporter permease [Armatimonadota bacterium]